MARRATPKQIAYLNYLGQQGAAELSFEQAGALIESLGELRHVDEELTERMGTWSWRRHRLHPDLYPCPDPAGETVELFGEAYRSYVRARHVNCSRRLTKEVLEDAVARIFEEDDLYGPGAEPPSELVYLALTIHHPGCVDGPHPEVRKLERTPLLSDRRPPAYLSHPKYRPPKRRRRKPKGWEIAALAALAIAAAAVLAWAAMIAMG